MEKGGDGGEEQDMRFEGKEGGGEGGGGGTNGETGALGEVEHGNE